MNDRRTGTDRESKLLADIGKLSDNVRELRRAGAFQNAIQIKALETQSRAKWQELRTLRAGGNVAEFPPPNAGGSYR